MKEKEIKIDRYRQKKQVIVKYTDTQLIKIYTIQHTKLIHISFLPLFSLRNRRSKRIFMVIAEEISKE